MPRALILLACLSAALPARALHLSSATVSDIHQFISDTPPPTPGLRKLPAFPEHLTYEVRWGIITVGNATLNVEKLVSFGGEPAYALASEAVSNAFCDTFYKVRDLNESWIDARTLASLGYSKKLREGHFYRDEWVLFDQRHGEYLAKTTHRDGSFGFRAGTAPIPVQDILSSLYFIRDKPLDVGGEFVLDVNTKENWPLVVRVIKREKIRTAAGTFDTVLVEPALRREGIFVQKGKRLQIWLSDDARRVPVLMKVEVFFGHITTSLTKADPPLPEAR